jgi:GxxExxY protein
MEDIMELCDVVRDTGFAIHRYHKHGHLEKVYENALAHRLRKLGLDVKQQHPLKVYDEDGTLIGDYNAELFVDGRLIMELKAAKALADEHVAQVLGYLRASRIEHGLLINFGAPKFEIKKHALSQPGQGGGPGEVASALLSAFVMPTLQIAQFREDFLCKCTRQTESWPHRIMQKETQGRRTSMILSGHDSVLSGCGFAALCFLRLFAADSPGVPQCVPPPGPNITGCNASWN